MLAALALAVALPLGGMLLSPDPATAVPTAASSQPPVSPDAIEPSSESPSPPASPSAPPIADPSISSPTPGELLSGSVSIVGAAEPNSSIQVLSSAQSDPVCATAADNSGAWSCSTNNLPSGPNLTLRVVQLVSGYDNRSASVTVNLLNAPTAGSGSGNGTSTGYATVRGSAYPGATVTATAGAYSCSFTADSAGGWACNLGSSIPSGTLSVSATQSTSWSGGSSPASEAFTLTIDSETPPAPSITTPVAGQSISTRGATISGRGENGALVTVFAGSFSACTTTVVGSTWSCTSADLTAGSVSLSAIQQDTAGNVSAESAPFAVTLVAAIAPPSPSSPGSPAATPAPGSTAATPAPQVSGATPSPSGQPTGAAAAPGDGAASGTPGAAGSGQGSPGDSGDSAGPGGSAAAPNANAAEPNLEGTWAASTRFSAALQPAFGLNSAANWWIALAVAVAAILLIAAPGRLLALALDRARGGSREQPTRGTTSWRLPYRRLTGRNRARTEFDRAPDVTFNPWAVAVAGLVAAAAIGMLSGPIGNQPAYLRLFIAIIIAFAVLNAAWAWLGSLLANRLLGVKAQVGFAPRYLLIAAGLALGSRLFDLQPALLFGLVLSVGCSSVVQRRTRGQFALTQLATLVGLGLLAWVLTALVPETPDAFSVLASEVLNTLVLGAFGAAAIMVLPFGRLAGRSILAWSRLGWAGAAVVSFTLLAAVLSPSFELAHRAVAIAPVLVVAVAFAAVCASIWVWLKFVAPALK